MAIITISLSNLHLRYKMYYEDLKEYFGKDDYIMWFGNHPLVIFAKDYVKYGNKILDNLDDHPFIVYEYKRYKDSETVKNNTHKYTSSKRIIDIVDSIKKYGYCEGKYNHPKNMINVIEGFKNPYGFGKNGYTLKSRKHRAAACIALGIKDIKVKV